MRYLLSLVVLCTLSAFSSAQQQKCTVVLLDGSRVYGTVVDKDLEVANRYGKMTIPWLEIQHLKLGLHFPENTKTEIDVAIKGLASGDFKNRDTSHKKLVALGRVSYLPVSDHVPEKADAEVTRRLETIKKEIEEGIPTAELRKVDHDFIISNDITMKGKLVKGTVRIKTTYLGDVDLKICSIDRFIFDIAGGTFKIDGSKHATKPVQWFDTGVTINANNKWTIRATGIIDMWPQTPNQYNASPKGMTANAAIVEGFPAGALIGRVGESGEFLVSEYYTSGSSAVQGLSGRLYLRINPAAWPNAVQPPFGNYEVTIETTK